VRGEEPRDLSAAGSCDRREETALREPHAGDRRDRDDSGQEGAGGRAAGPEHEPDGRPSDERGQKSCTEEVGGGAPAASVRSESPGRDERRQPERRGWPEADRETGAVDQ